MYDKFEKFLLKTIQNKLERRIILIATGVLFVIAILMIAPTKLVLAKMLPGKNNDTFTIYTTLAQGSSIHMTKKVTDCVVSLMQKEKEVLNLEVFLGMGSPLDFAGLIKGSNFKNSENVAEIVVNITKAHHRDEPSYLMVQRIRPEIQGTCEAIYKNTNISFVEPPAGPPVLSAIVAEVYGNNAKGIRHLSKRVEDVFKSVDGLVDIDRMVDEIYDTFEVVVDTQKISRSGVDIKQLNNILYLAFEGMEISVKNSKKYNDQIPIFLSLSKESRSFTRKDLRSVKAKLTSLKLMNNMGMMIPITELVSIKPIKSNPMILTKNLHQMTNVMAETDMVSQVYPLMEARDIILNTFTDEYKITKTGLFNLELTDRKTLLSYKLLWDGEMEVTLDTFVELGAAFIAALILIFLLMVIYYKSYTLSGIILLGSFLSIIGVIIGHWIMNIFTTDTFFLTATSLIGYIALIGISSRNSLLLIDFTKQLMDEKGMHKYEAIAYSTATRAKPIFLTAVAIILASTLLAGDAVFGGLGVSLIFGTMAAVAVSLLVVPVLLSLSNLEQHFHFHEKKSVSIELP
jgi:multidrug efflux pump subunit AcrB